MPAIRLSTPVGDLLVMADATGLLLCEFAEGRDAELKAEQFEGARADAAMLDRVRDELNAYFAGNLKRFTVPIPAMGTPFQQQAWAALTDIPYGETRTYGQQAKAIGNPAAVRAIGRANGSNFRAIIIPCHRVIGSAGTLTGFGGGLPCKQWLLDHERGSLFAG
jgi:O-6-methylguanine DNA methyltransferase